MVTLRLKKKADGSSALTFVRADGTTAWQRQSVKHAGFFPIHDLTHYAVESELGLSRAFCGLVGEGWGFDDFGAPWPRGPLPDEALFAEALVGILDMDRAMALHTGAPATAAELNERLDDFYASRDLGVSALRVDDVSLARVRARLKELFAQWEVLPAGDALEVHFGAR